MELQKVPNESIDTIITSPPYWGLKDYGTVKWESGDDKCDHKMPRSTNRHRPGDKSATNKGSDPITWNVCGKCGAKRIDEQLGLEKTPEEYVSKMVEVFREVKRVLKKEGTLWLNLGDSYVSGKSRYSSNEQTISGKNRGEPKQGKKPDMYYHPVLKDKDLTGIPWRVAFALQADGWYLRQDIIWAKPNLMPESITDRCTKSHEYIFLLAKSLKYYFDNEAIKEKSVGYDPRMIDGFVPKSVNGKHSKDSQNATNRKRYKPTEAGGGTSMINHSGYFKANGEPIGYPGTRNKRDVWTITTSSYPDAHFATFPEDLIVPMVLAGCPKNGVVLDPFIGAGTVAVVARKLDRNYIGIELNPKYIEMAEARIKSVPQKLI